MGAHSILALYEVTLDGIFDIILGSDWNGLDGYEDFLLKQDTYMFGFGYRIDLEGSRYG